MSQPKQYLCKNRDGNCPNYVKSTVVTVGGTQKFECPLGLANCEKDHLEPISPPESALKKTIKKFSIIAVPLICVGLIGWLVFRGHKIPPVQLPKSDIVVVVDGQLLNAVMVRTPDWLANQTTGITNLNGLLSFGLWGCRPVEPNGEIETQLRNYAPTLMTLHDFMHLEVPSAPKPESWSEKLRTGTPSYDLFSDLKTILQETRWDTPTNRFLVIITESSAFDKSSEKNAAGLDERQVKHLADTANAKICSIHILVPSSQMADDQKLAEAQLHVLSDYSTQTCYFPIHKTKLTTPNHDDNVEIVTAYADGVKQAFNQILERVNQQYTAR